MGRTCLLQVSASYSMRLSMGDVKTTFPPGNLGESERGAYGDLPDDARSPFGVSEDEVIKLEGSIYGLSATPKAWFQHVATDLKGLGSRQHPLGQCVCMLCTSDNELLGVIWGVCG